MIVLAALALLALSIVVIAYPLFKREREVAYEAPEAGPLEQLYDKRDELYSVIEELKFDREAGSLSDKDYQDLEATYAVKAISTLKEIDAAKETEPAPRKPSAPAGAAEPDVENEIRRHRKPRFCTGCGAPRLADAKFCPQCGARFGGNA